MRLREPMDVGHAQLKCEVAAWSLATMGEHALSTEELEQFVREAVGDSMHAARVGSLAATVGGVMHAAALGVTVIGVAMARAQGILARSGVKQVDRLLSNTMLNAWKLFAHWVPYVVAARTEVVVALDWTDFDDDDQTTICLNLLTSHGQATPLVWQTLTKSGLKGNRTEAEHLLLERLREVMPAGVQKVTVLADRGFGSVDLYGLLADWRWDFVIRFRGVIDVQSEAGEVRKAQDWLQPQGRARKLSDARVTGTRHLLPAVVVTKQKGMKDAWFLASSLGKASATAIIHLYGRRIAIEEAFRDQKDWRLGLGLVHVAIKDCDRRDRMLLISAMAVVLLTLLGAASEPTGLDRDLRVNTVKKRTHSLFNQGLYYFGALTNMHHEAKAAALVARFDEFVRSAPFFCGVFGLVWSRN